MNSLTASALALAMVAPAGAYEFDPATCKTFLVGAWTMQDSITTPDGMAMGGSLWTTELKADGSYTKTGTTYAEGNPKGMESTGAGTWGAEAGAKPQSCLLIRTAERRAPWTDTYVVSGPDTMIDQDGDRATRTK